MANTINWMGNRVLDSTASRQSAQTAMPPAAQPGRFSSTPITTQQTTFPPTTTQQTTFPPVPTQQDFLMLPDTQQGPPPATERGYIPYFLASNIGRSVRAEFIIGSNQYVDKTGILSEVGINYFVLTDPSLRTKTMCDLYSVKFVTFLQPQ